jgi:hypothetical protein
VYALPNIIKIIKSNRMRWEGYIARMGEKKNAHDIFLIKSAGKRPLGRRRRRWEDNIKMDIREIGLKGVDWIHLAQDRNQWRDPYQSIDYYLSRRTLLHRVSSPVERTMKQQLKMHSKCEHCKPCNGHSDPPVTSHFITQTARC